MDCPTRMLCFVLLFLGFFVCGGAMADGTVPGKTEVQLKQEKKVRVAEAIKAEQEAAAKAKREAEIEQLKLPEDTSTRFSVRQLHISGNTLVSTDELLKNMPLVYNASDKSMEQADAGDLYDFRVLHLIIQEPGELREVSRRTMQGFTQYILSVYQSHDYAGIYIYIPAQVVKDGMELQDGILPLEVVEGKISEITTTAYNINREKVEKGILRSSLIEAWSPVEVGQVVNKKKLDDFVNQLNLNPDRYVSAVISRGSEPDSLALGYDVYEADPWHYYIQLDNSGAKERQWAPRFGVVNTNITGRDDRITAVYQGAPGSIRDNYSVFGSYDFPVFTPRLRFNLYGGLSEFAISGGGGIDFLGKGSFYGGVLRLNVLQMDSWNIDLTNSLSHERSKVTPSLFKTLETDIDMDLWGIGLDVRRSADMSTTSFSFGRLQSVGGSSKEDFVKAREGSDPHFDIYTVSAAHSQYLDPNKVQRLSGSVRWITSNERLAPSKMSTFGGLYSVRGYGEDEIVADGGILVSAQYEFDLVKYNKSRESRETETKETDKKAWLRKLTLLGFTDFARAVTKNPVAGEEKIQELCSVGIGTAVTLGDNLDAGIYYGYPLMETPDTRQRQGRWSFSFIVRW